MGIDPSIGPERARELFRAELAEVRTDTALQALRTRWIGRNNSWVAAFMEAPGRSNDRMSCDNRSCCSVSFCGFCR